MRAVITVYLSELKEGGSKILPCEGAGDEDIANQDDVTQFLYLIGINRFMRALNSSQHSDGSATHFVFDATITLLEEGQGTAAVQCDWDVKMTVSENKRKLLTSDVEGHSECLHPSRDDLVVEIKDRGNNFDQD